MNIKENDRIFGTNHLIIVGKLINTKNEVISTLPMQGQGINLFRIGNLLLLLYEKLKIKEITYRRM